MCGVDTYEESGGPRKSKEVEEGWISSLIDMVGAHRTWLFDWGLLYERRREYDNSVTGGRESLKENKSQPENKKKFSVAGPRHVMIELA